MSHGDVWTLAIRLARRDDAAALSAALFAAGAGGVEERDGPELVIYAATARELKALEAAARRALPEGSTATLTRARLAANAWQKPWTEALGPERVSPRFELCPAGVDAPVARGVHRLWFEPELVFGVGSHATTRLAAEAVERAVADAPGGTALDVGTGTGVLAMVAAASGARRTLGIDVDRRAVRSARRNAKLNRLSDRCQFSERPLASVKQRFDLVVANVEMPPLAALTPDLARVTARELIVTGLLTDVRERVEAPLLRAGLRVTAARERDGWLLLCLRRP